MGGNIIQKDWQLDGAHPDEFRCVRLQVGGGWAPHSHGHLFLLGFFSPLLLGALHLERLYIS